MAKIARRKNGYGGQILVAVPPKHVDAFEQALTFLEQLRGKKPSPLLVDLVLRTAKRNGWRPTPSTTAGIPDERIDVSL